MIDIGTTFQIPLILLLYIECDFFAAIGEFGFIGIHVKPDEAVAEIDALTDVYDDMVGRWGMTVSTCKTTSRQGLAMRGCQYYALSVRIKPGSLTFLNGGKLVHNLVFNIKRKRAFGSQSAEAIS